MIEPRKLNLASSVRYAKIDGYIVLLDFNTESYQVLNQVASMMWSVLIQETDWESQRKVLIDCYDVSDEVLDKDFVAFSANCILNSLLIEEDLPDVAPSVPKKQVQRLRLRFFPSILAAIFIYYKNLFTLTRKGFKAAYEQDVNPPTEDRTDSLLSAIRTFSRAEHFFFSPRSPNDCLVRSLSLYHFLTELSIPAEHVIGVCRVPFQAHAWVECRGVPILDQLGHDGRYFPIARLVTKPPSHS
jgi:hypothetical protein